MLVAVLFATTITPVAFAKEPPITLRITNLSNYDELVLEDETLVEAIWNELPSRVPYESSVNQEVNIQTNITNNQKKDQEMRLITQIKDSENITSLIASKRMVVPALASLTINQPWTPTEAKLYSIEVFIWQDFENPSPLGQPQNLQREPRESASCCRVGRVE
jgi:hypothetical protein